jgi:hypothetical protein
MARKGVEEQAGDGKLPVCCPRMLTEGLPSGWPGGVRYSVRHSGAMAMPPIGGMLGCAAPLVCPHDACLDACSGCSTRRRDAVSPLVSLSPPAASAVKGEVYGCAALDHAARG